MKLYHGSNCIITAIDLNCSRKYKDFGTGFYLTPDYSRAVIMASRRAELEDGSPEITAFMFYRNRCPSDLRIKEFGSNNWEWAEFVMLNRDKLSNPPYEHEYDIVIGPVADSSVDPVIKEYRQEFGDNFRKPENLKILASRLKYPGSKYIQYCFCTQKAIKQLLI